ncbi:SRPBCC domain-containing protein [Fictibacillus enclensis]|uniref:SRPBCC domain-containing protein n=1 Tax=Fictibacillus enclensis TaxID=1017270 RepID=UPI0025A2B080|nr:SRPBCC domain-containing protein [Fictibacillus enclensis]MDM5197423.1 SRPBCC domain-containing protein [Fictibacillus enclensis]
MKSLRTECVLPYPVDMVWEVISDTEKHALWNPQIVSIKGECNKGSSLSVCVRSPVGGGLPFRFKASVKDLDSGKKLAWTGGVPGILTGYHYWELTDLGDQTRLVQGEVFTGLFTSVLSQKRIDSMLPSYESANTGLHNYLKKQF